MIYNFITQFEVATEKWRDDMEQVHITKSTPLLNKHGVLQEPGYATQMLYS